MNSFWTTTVSTFDDDSRVKTCGCIVKSIDFTQTLIVAEKPHNPMVNAGAIMVCAVLKTLVHPEMKLAEKFDYTQDYFRVSALVCYNSRTATYPSC